MVSRIAVALYMASAAEDCSLGVNFQGWLLLAVDQSSVFIHGLATIHCMFILSAFMTLCQPYSATDLEELLG